MKRALYKCGIFIKINAKFLSTVIKPFVTKPESGMAKLSTYRPFQYKVIWNRSMLFTTTGFLFQVYSMKQRQRGVCLILSNKNYSDPENIRHGTEKDVDNMQQLFSQLHFCIETRTDLSKNVSWYLPFCHMYFLAFLQ